MTYLFKLLTVLLAILLLILTASGCSTKPAANEKTSNFHIGNIETFARLYGYVKYFYPGDEAAGLDWENFAIYGAKRVENAKNREELKTALEELFHPVAPALEIYKTSEKKTFSNDSIMPPDTGKMKVVSWQHLGLELDYKSIYKSVRLNRVYQSSDHRGFGNVFTSVDAAAFRGKEIRFKAAVKVKEGKGQLWLRVDRADRKTGFFDNMGDRPVKPSQSSDWNYCEITGPIADDALKVYFGCMLVGNGRLWTDDFQLYVRDKGGSEWEPVTITDPDFETGEEGKSPEKYILNRRAHLYRVTGTEAASGKQSVEVYSKSGELVGPEGIFPGKAGFGEHIVKELGSGLSSMMPIALYGTETQTFPKAPEARLKALKAAIQAGTPEKPSGDDLHVRLGDMVIGWNILRHFFPYTDISKVDWKAELTKGLTGAYNDKSAVDFLKTLQEFIAALKDGHGRVNLAGEAKNSALAPIGWELIEGQLVVTRVCDESVTSVRVGDIVTALDGVPVKEVMEREKQYISAATEGWLRHRLMTELIRGVKDSTLKLNIDRGGKSIEVSVSRSMNAADFFAGRGSTVKSKVIEEGIYYLNLGRIPWKEITDLMPELEKARAIICDLRGYPKGNHMLISHLLTEKDTSDAWMRVPQLIYPDYEKVTYKHIGWKMPTAEPHLSAKIIFITGGGAISYAESYMGLIDHYKLATIVGQTTAGTNGNINPFRLPGGYRVLWTGMRVVRHDGSRHHGVGIKPHFPVKRTIKGVKEGRDEFLEKAIEIAKQ